MRHPMEEFRNESLDEVTRMDDLESLQDEVIDELDRLNLRIESLLATMVKQAPELEIDSEAA